MDSKYLYISAILAIGIFIAIWYLQKTNECIDELNILENFGISKSEVTILESQCSTCSPWYTPQVSGFSATLLDSLGRKYLINFSNNCPRHADSLIRYSVISDEKTELLDKIKGKLCADFSDWTIYLYQCQDKNNLGDFISCVNNYSYYIESGIINVTEDWTYCSSEGWKNCDEWNSCEPSGPSHTSVCTPEYCKRSCLLVYSDRRIQKHFTEVCKAKEVVEDGKIIFSFNVPEDIKNLISKNYLKPPSPDNKI